MLCCPLAPSEAAVEGGGGIGVGGGLAVTVLYVKRGDGEGYRDQGGTGFSIVTFQLSKIHDGMSGGFFSGRFLLFLYQIKPNVHSRRTRSFILNHAFSFFSLYKEVTVYIQKVPLLV